MILDALIDAAWDSLRALPFLFAAFILMEMLEKHSDKLVDRIFNRIGRSGPLIGAVMGLVPQCGFSAAMSNLYAGGVVTLGTLIAVFLSTSDEAVIIMMSSPDAVSRIAPLLAAKFIIAAVFGFAVDLIMHNSAMHTHFDEICTDCGCHEKKGIIGPVLVHTRRVFLWLFVISFILNVLLEMIGSEQLAGMLGSNTVFQPLITALIGLIPNCAVSVMFTKLYLAGTLSFASTVAGLSSGAGLGLIVLFRMNKKKSDTVRIAVILYLCAAAAGIIAELFA